MFKAHWVLLGIALAVLAYSLFQYRPAGDSRSSYYEKRTNWNELPGGEMNISVFAFRDLNRNGVYDLEDRPMAGIAFELDGPNNQRVIKRSNINGFGNFKMSALKEKADVVNPGKYIYRAITPPGWELTTHNDVQRTSFEIRPGSVGGMISSTPAAPVGFAQSLTIGGRVNLSSSSGTPKISATSPSGKEVSVSLDENGDFLIAAERGTWLIEASDSSGSKADRAVKVDRASVVLSQMMLGQSDAGIAPHTRTLGFDDLIRTESIVEVPAGYGGIGWRNWVVTHNQTYVGGGYVNNTVSGEYVAYNSSGHPVEVFDQKPFDFIGGYFGVAWITSEGETLRLEGWRGDKIVFHDEIELSALGPVYFDANYTDVTLMKFSTSHFWQFVCDDITFGFRQ